MAIVSSVNRRFMLRCSPQLLSFLLTIEKNMGINFKLYPSISPYISLSYTEVSWNGGTPESSILKHFPW